MSRLDRYLLAQLMALFGFFALVLVAVYWLNQAVRLFNQLIADGQSARVVLELTSLALPVVIALLLPVAAFAASIFAINRLIGESEMVVMQATGASPWRLARPVLAFGLIVALLMTMLVHVLVPMARARSVERRAEIADNVASRFLTEGQFQHPAAGVTFFIREISARGELLDIYLADNRNAANSTVFLASKAVIARSDTGPKLIMIEGMAQNLRGADDRLSVTQFADFTYDLAALMANGAPRAPRLEELTTPKLLSGASGANSEAVRFELAKRIATTLSAPVAALVGFAALMLGGFSQFGVWRQIAVAVALQTSLQFLGNAAENAAMQAPGRWPLLWLPLAVGVAMVAALLWQAQRPRRLRRRAAAPEAPA